MGSRYRVGWLRKLHLMLLAAASLAMLSVSVTALSAQEVPGGATESPDPPGRPGPAQEPATGTPVEPLTQPPAEPPVEAPVEPSVGTPAGLTGTCDHAAGEFLVGYVSEEALLAAPQENVAEDFDGILAQHLVYDEIKNTPDPAARLAAEEAKRQELAARPGVAYVEYNCMAEVYQAASADEGASIRSIPSPASCGDCGKSVVEGARRIIADGFEGAGSKDAFEAALEAARSVDEDNLAFAAEAELDQAAADDPYADGSGAEGGGDGDTESYADGADDEEADETGAGESGSGPDDEESADSESVSGDEASDEAEAGLTDEEEDTGAGSPGAAGPVSGKNAAASEEPREVSGPGVLALGAGILLLAAGVVVGRRILGG